MSSLPRSYSGNWLDEAFAAATANHKAVKSAAVAALVAGLSTMQLQEVAPAARTSSMAMQWNENDLLSKLPNDCMRGIFEHLDRDDLDVVRSVSQRLHSFAEECESVKRRLQSLTVAQRKDTEFFFHAKSVHTPARSYTVLVKVASNAKATDGVYQEGTYAVFGRTTRGGEDEGSFDENRILWTNAMDDHKSVPIQFYYALEKFMERSEVEELRLWNIYLTDRFLESCASIFFGKVSQLHLRNSIPSRKADMKFSDLLIKLDPESTEIADCDELVEQEFDHRFLLQYAAKSKYTQQQQLLQLQLRVQVQPDENRSFHNAPASRVLARFSELIHHSLLADYTTSMNLVNIVLSQPNAIAHYEFRMRSSDDFMMFQGLRNIENLTCTHDDLERTITFTRDDNENSAKIVFKDYLYRDENGVGVPDRFPIVVIDIYDNQEWLE